MMKKILPLIVLLFLSTVLFGQHQYQVMVEGSNEKTYKGIISQEVLLADTSFKWYAANLKGYNPNKGGLELLVFMGTWCEDSHVIIPKFYSLLEAAAFSKDKVTLIGVDRSKVTLSHLAEALNIKSVPTIIILKNGKELGRVVEYGKYGLFDMEMGEILKTAN
jgi:thiol-disulfide isomerase/thioredoxin